MQKIIFTLLIFIVAMDTNAQNTKYTVIKTDAEWRNQLSAEQYQVTRKKGTERAYSGVYWDNHATGIYKCMLRTGAIQFRYQI